MTCFPHLHVYYLFLTCNLLNIHISVPINNNVSLDPKYLSYILYFSEFFILFSEFIVPKKLTLPPAEKEREPSLSLILQSKLIIRIQFLAYCVIYDVMAILNQTTGWKYVNFYSIFEYLIFESFSATGSLHILSSDWYNYRVSKNLYPRFSSVKI